MLEKDIVREAGMVDGVFHHVAAVNPCEGKSPDYRYAFFHHNESKDQNVEWVFLFEDKKKVFAFGWLGTPIRSFGEVSDGLNFSVRNFLDDLGKQGKTLEEARDAVLKKWEHSEVYTGTIVAFETIF